MGIEQVTAFRITDGSCYEDKGEAYKAERRVLLQRLRALIPEQSNPASSVREWERLVRAVREWLAAVEVGTRQLAGEGEEVATRVARQE